MNLRLGRGASGVLTSHLLTSGTAYRLMVQGSLQPSVLHGVRLEPHEGLELRINGIVKPLADTLPVSIGEPLSLAISQEALRRSVPSDGTSFITLLVLDEAWRVGARWQVSVHTIASEARVRVVSLAKRLATVLISSASERATTATVTWPTGELRVAWGGLRDRRTGGRAWLLPMGGGAPQGAIPFLSSFTATVADDHGNETAMPVTIPEPPERIPPELAWALPFWLPPTGELGHVLSAFSEGLDVEMEPSSALSPRRASGAMLDIHARLGGVERFLGEDEASLRLRATALGDRQHLNARSLERHLTAVAGVMVQIGDQLTNVALEVLVRLTGAHQLDGTWTLGGIEGGDLAPGRFVVHLREMPRAPLGLVLRELERLRPAGRLTTLQLGHRADLPLSPRLHGVLEQRVEHGLDTTLFAGFRRLDGTWTLNGAIQLNQTTVSMTFA